MATEGKKPRKERELKKFRFINNKQVLEENRLDRGSKQKAIVISVLQHLPMPTDSRTVSRAIAAHPEFKTKLTRETSSGIPPEERVWNYWRHLFKGLGLIEIVEDGVVADVLPQPD